MARRSPLLLLVLMPPLALGALFFLGDSPPPQEEAARAAQEAPEPKRPGAHLAEAAPPAAAAENIPTSAVAAPAIDPTTSRAGRVGLAARIEGSIAYTTGAVPGGQVLVVAGLPGDSWSWERAARLVHAGKAADALVHGFADAEGRFALEWTGKETELAVAALAPTAATASPAAWLADAEAPLTLTLEPRAALFVDVKAGPGYAAGAEPAFRGAELELRRPSIGPEAALEAPSLPNEADDAEGEDDKPAEVAGWVDGRGRAAILAARVAQRFELSYAGDDGAPTVLPVATLRAGEQRAVTLEIGAGARVFGRVVDEAGSPVAEADVRVHGAGPFGMPGRRLLGVKSAADGRFEVGHAPLSSAAVVLSKTGYLIANSALPEDLTEGSQHDLGDLVLAHGVRLVGHVRWADGSPAAGAQISAQIDPMSLGQTGGFNAWRGYQTKSTADNEGRFALSGLASGARYDLVATADADGTHARASQRGVREGHADLVLVLEPSPTLVGRVLTPDGQPWAGAQVRAKPEAKGGNPWMGTQVAARFAETDAEGNFQLALEEAGTVFLDAHAEGFASSATLSIEAPSEVAIELHLLPSQTVAGRVLDPEGRPVEGATVGRASSFRERIQAVGSLGVPTATSGPDGSFALVDLPAGELVLEARHPEHTVSANVAVELIEGQAPTDVVLTLRRGAIVRGVVFDKGERAEAGVSIIATAMPEMETRMASTDGAGEFVLERLTPGRWNVVSMGGMDMGSGDAEAGMAALLENLKMQMLELEDGVVYDVELGAPPKNPVTVSGVVSRAEEPLSRGMLSFVPKEGGYAGMKIATLDSAGRYELVLPEPGSYLVTAGSGEMGGPGNTGNQVELRCEVPAGDSYEFNVELPGGAIRGRVRGPDGRPVVGAMVTWSREDGMAFGTLMGGGYGTAQTDDQGNYELTLLGPGRYRVAAGGNNFGGMLDESPTTARGLRTGVELGSDEVREGVDFELVTPGEVRGRVRDSAGKPVSAMAIFARDGSGAPVETMSFVQSDPSGNFRWRGLAPGDYTFHARGGERASAESSRVKVRAGEVAEVELVVGDGAYLIVLVEGTDTSELMQGLVRVDVRDGDDRQVGGLFSMEDFANMLSTDRSFDEQRFGPLAPGSYRASATGPDGKRVEKRVELSPGQERRLRLRLKD